MRSFKSEQWEQLEKETAMIKAIDQMGIAFDETLEIGSFLHPRYYDSDIVIYRGDNEYNVDLKDATGGSFQLKATRVASLLKYDAHNFIDYYFDVDKQEYRTYDRSTNSFISTWYRILKLMLHERTLNNRKSLNGNDFNDNDNLFLSLAFNSHCIKQEYKTTHYCIKVDNDMYMLTSNQMKKYVTVYLKPMKNKPLENEPQMTVDGEKRNVGLQFKVLTTDLKKDIANGLYPTIREWYL